VADQVHGDLLASDLDRTEEVIGAWALVTKSTRSRHMGAALSLLDSRPLHVTVDAQVGTPVVPDALIVAGPELLRKRIDLLLDRVELFVRELIVDQLLIQHVELRVDAPAHVDEAVFGDLAHLDHLLSRREGLGLRLATGGEEERRDGEGDGWGTHGQEGSGRSEPRTHRGAQPLPEECGSATMRAPSSHRFAGEK